MNTRIYPELVRDAALGNVTAQEDLLRRLRRPIHYHATKYTFPGFETADVYQELRVAVLVGIKRYYEYRPGENPWAYLWVLLHRAAVTLLKHATRNNKRLLWQQVEFEPRTNEEGETWPAPRINDYTAYDDPTPDLIDRLALREQISTFLPRLSRGERRALLLLAAGLTYREMARELGCSTKTVDNAIARVRRKAAQSWDPEGKPPTPPIADRKDVR